MARCGATRGALARRGSRHPRRPTGDMLHLTPWLVLSSFETGITGDHLLEAKRILAGPAPRSTRSR